MELRQLKYFLAVAEQLNFRKAAESLYVTQPLLSKQIADLEYELGTPLLVRNTRQVQLTPAGERLKQEASQILRQTDTIAKTVRRAASGEEHGGILKVAYEQAFDRNALVQALQVLRRKEPDIDVVMYARSFSQCIALLNASAVDCAFIVLPDKNFSEHLTCQVLHSDALCFVANRDLVDEDDLETFLRLMQEKTLYLLEKSPKGMKLLGDALARVDAVPETMLAEDLPSMLLYAEIGAGVAMVPYSVYQRYGSPFLSACPLPSQASQLCMACAWNGQSPSPLRERLLECMPHQEMLCGTCQNIWCRCHL